MVGTSTHFTGARAKQMIEAYEAGDVAAALHLHHQLLPLFTGIFRTQGTILVKAALNLLGLPAGPVRSPLVEATEAEIVAAACRRGPGRAGPAGASQVSTPTEGAPASVAVAVDSRNLTHGELGEPPPLPAGALRVIPLGGLGAIGRNMTVFEYDGKLLVVDCGVLFPDVDQPGVDLILPDFSAILDRLDDVQAIVLTHGHEDHIGAVPYLLAHKQDIPLVGSQFTLALVEAKLAERRIEPYSLTVREGQRERLGPFECEFFAVNHSIPDALAVAIRTPAGIVLHTGDFKMDQLPLDGRLTDLAGFARLGAEGVDLLLSDSTNAEIPGFVAPEREIGPVLDSDLPLGQGPDHRGLVRLPRPPCPAGAGLGPRSTGGRWPSSAARWSATWVSPATWACCASPAGWWSGWTRRPRCRPSRSC